MQTFFRCQRTGSLAMHVYSSPKSLYRSPKKEVRSAVHGAAAEGFWFPSHKYVWSIVGIPIVFGVEGFGHLPTRVVSIASWQSWIAQRAVSAQLHPHVLLPAIEVSIYESRRGGIPGTNYSMDTPRNHDHAVKPKTESVSQWYGICMKPYACAGWK